MRRLAFVLAALLIAASAGAATPYFLDRDGALWKATAEHDGLLLIGTRGDEQIVNSLVPFPVGMPGTFDSEIQVAADDLTGRVAVVWQRNWSERITEIMVAIWGHGEWEQIIHLTDGLADHPRNPVIELTQASTTIPDAEYPEDLTRATVVSESFLHVLWWEGEDEEQHASYSFVRLTSPEENEEQSRNIYNLEKHVPLGLYCHSPAPPNVLEHPQFASQAAKDRPMLFFGSGRFCLFEAVEINFSLVGGEPTSSQAKTTVAGRRRHMPIFGVKQLYGVPSGMSLENARVMIGADLLPVAYRIDGDQLEYVFATQRGWSPKRTLVPQKGLTLDLAIPLVENLAR